MHIRSRQRREEKGERGMKWGGGGSPLTSGYGECDDDEYADVDDVDTPDPNKCQR